LVGERKLGLGRSAATLVAAAAALAPDEPPARILARALEANGLFQAGQGGGAGVAAAVHGGPVGGRAGGGGPPRGRAGAAGGPAPGRRLDRLAGSDDTAAGALCDRADAGRARRPVGGRGCGRKRRRAG